MKTRPLNCYKCGKFVGKDGFNDVYYDDYNGGYEIGYPECASCLKHSAISKKQKSKPGSITADTIPG